MPDEDKPVPLRPATPARSRLRPVPEPAATAEVEDEGSVDATPEASPAAPRLVDRIQELAERIEEETAGTSKAERQSELPAKVVREATARHAESAAQRVAEVAAGRGRHEAPAPLPPLPLPSEGPADETPEADAPPPVVVDEGPVTEPAAPPPPVKKVPAKKAPAKKAAAKKAAAPVEKVAAPVEKAPAKKAPAKKAPAKKAPAKKAPTTEVRRGAPAPPARPLPRPAAATATPPPPQLPPAPPPPRVVAPTTVVPEQRSPSRVGKLLATLSVLLLALAAGLGTAAFVLTGEETWESRVAVRLVPGPVPTVDPETSVREGVERYSDRVPGLTLPAAAAMGIPRDDIRGTFEAAHPEPDVIGIVVHAAHRNQAALLAGAAANELMKAVTEQEKTAAPTAADRLAAVITGSVTKPERTRPDNAVAALAGGLAAVAVLLVGGLVAVLRRNA